MIPGPGQTSPDPNIILYAVGSSHHRNGASFDFQIAAANIRIIPGPERPIRIRILCTVGGIQHKLESQLWFLFKLLGPINNNSRSRQTVQI